MSEAIKPKHARDFDFPITGKRWFYRIAQYFLANEHMYDTEPDKYLLHDLKSRGVDLFTFIERSFLGSSARKEHSFFRSSETIGLLRLTSYDDWMNSIPSKTRQIVRKAQRMGLKVRVVDIDEKFAKGALRIYNERPVREGRKYSGYGLSLEDVMAKFARMGDSEVLGAYFDEDLIGFIWVSYGDRVVSAGRSFLSLISHRDKYPNNCLIAETVKRCCQRGYRFVTYGNMGYNPGLDFFKKANGFRIFRVPRFYVPLSAKGQLAIRLRLYQSLEHSFSPTITRALVPFYSILNKSLPT